LNYSLEINLAQSVCDILSLIADMSRPVEKVSTGQQIAITATGILFTRLSLVVVPINYNLASVNVFMAGTGMMQLYRKYDAGILMDFMEKDESSAGKKE